MLKSISLLLLFIWFLPACADGPAINDYLVREVTVNDKTYGYRVLVPPNRDPNKKLPVMLYLHGGGSRGDDNREQASAFVSAIDGTKDKLDFIVVLPQCRDATFWASSEMSNQALAALDAAVAEFNGDPDRLYLAGFSLGGYGTWQIAAANTGKFAALVPVAGGVVGQQPIEPRDRALIIPAVGEMLDSPEPYKAVAEAIGHTPVWVFHGTNDDAVPVDFARKIVKALEENGSRNVKYTEYVNDGHIIFGKVFAEPGFFDWLAEQKLSRTK